MPAKSTVMEWLEAHETFRTKYARAREYQADSLFDEMLDISDDGSNDTYIDREGNIRIDHDVLGRSKLRLETRRWMVMKLRPKKYGEKLELDGGLKHEAGDTLTQFLTELRKKRPASEEK